METTETKQPAEPFIDVVEARQENPDLFTARDEEEVNGLKMGDYAKISTAGEYFWVKVTAVDGDTVLGEINNDLKLTEKHGLKEHDIIQFEKKHILEVES